MIADHMAAAGSQELSVHKGQQVEVLELNTATPDWCLVRMPTSGSSVDSPPEGLVPLAVLKQPPPGLKTSPSRRAASDHDSGEYNALLSLQILSYLLAPPGGTQQHEKPSEVRFPLRELAAPAISCFHGGLK